MASETSIKRAKRLVKRLFTLQLHDQELTGPLCLSIKHELRNSKYCMVFEIPDGPDTALTILADRSTVPKFISSQLEAHKLTSQETSVIFLNPLVHFILCSIPSERLTTVPTTAALFLWQTTRLYYIFAFVDSAFMMPSQKYSVQELLNLRDLGVPINLPDAPQKGANYAIDTGSIGRHVGGESRTLGRFHKYRPFHTQQSSAARSRIEFPVVAADEAIYARQQPRREATTSVPGEMEWRYRGRTGSEAAASAEPLPAPTGINAQQSEGFQRFYKAVVSPSHVRVTAGGRIVPNTRGTSPMSKRTKEKAEEGSSVKDSDSKAGEQTQQVPEGPHVVGQNAPSLPLFAYPPHAFYPPFSAQLPGMPMMQLPMGLGMPGAFPFPPPSAPPAGIPQFMPAELPKNTAKENFQNGDRRESSSFKAPVDKADENPRRMPSEQFDRSKPFMMNGQVVYPFAPPAVPPHMASGLSSQIPPGLLGHPNFPLSAFHNTLMGPHPGGMNPAFNTSMGFPGLNGPFQSLQAHQSQPGPQGPVNVAAAPSSANVPQAPSAPPISSIRPSEISRKQIDMLRGSLKYHEDQLLYNKHQIDEKEMEHTIQMLQSQIDRFEALNQSQLRFEEAHYPKKEVKPVEANGPSHRAINRASRSSVSIQGTIKHGSSSTRRSDSIRHRNVIRKREPLFHMNPNGSSLSISDPIKKSTLPSKAALAPPFEPRSLINAEVPRIGGSCQWDGAAVDEGIMSCRVNGDGGAANAQGQDKNLSFAAAAKKSNSPKPYLVGTLPPGIDPKNARETDYIYERELTPDETRSRYLFWGRAPSFTRRGLPKFDGKDFYPASPGNTTKRDSPPSSLLGRHVPIGDPNVDYYTGAFQPKDAQAPRPGYPGRYASEFRRERQKPVKVTLRRPDPETSVKRPQVKDSNSKATDEAVKKADQGGKPEAQSDNRTKFLHTVLKRNISTNSEVLPGALTSTTVQGVLPQYTAGYESLVAASLSPVRQSPVATGRLSPVKSDDGSSIFITPASRKIGENRPPPDSLGTTSLEQQLQGMALVDDEINASLLL